ncbi:histone-like nucleoid-structuring protein Lsr2 [Streptomyces sp. NPDC042207]|uniref:Lsr2 family DNA-binding protein n=1 Tax=Streptomyces sp. NPDC042207 TaxID=3154331 RepID=UPI0033DFB129
MTVAALRRLLNEIDTQGGPEAARHNRLHLTDEGAAPTMTTAPVLRPTPSTVDVQLKANADVHLRPATETPEQLPVGKLLAWGDQHTDPNVQDQAARARIALHGLRQRYAADRELTAITTEREQLEQRLAELQAREEQLAPAKAKKKRSSPARDYDPGTVRTWAAENGIDCPRVGRVPKAVVDAWRTATQPTA